MEIKPSRLTKFLQWGERQGFIVQAVVVLPAALTVGVLVLFSKKLVRKSGIGGGNGTT